MKRIFACAAALSLALVACGDDSSASAGNSTHEVSMGFKGCYERGSTKVALLKEGSEDSPKAYLYHENDKYQVMIPKISDYCTFLDVILDVNRFGDTLSVEVKSIIPSKCVCVSDHWFDIEAKDADIKYFKFKKDVYEVVPGPAPDEPYSSAVLPGESSSSVTPPGESSSSVTPPGESSSSVTPPGSSSGVTPPGESSSSILDSLRNVSMKFTGCYESPYNKVALLKEAATDELPKAYLYEESGKYRLMIPKMDDYCGFDKVMMDVERSGDTLRIDVTAMIPTACKCTSDHWFDIDASDADIKYFAHAPYNKKETLYEVVPGPAPEGL